LHNVSTFELETFCRGRSLKLVVGMNLKMEKFTIVTIVVLANNPVQIIFISKNVYNENCP